MTDQKTAARTGKNILFNGLSKIYELVAALIWTGLIARYLGRDGFGEYTLLWSIVTMAIIIPEIGLNNLLIREVSRNKKNAPALLAATIRVRRILALVAICFVLTTLLIITDEQTLHLAVLPGSIWILGRLAISTNSAIYFAFERIQYDMIVTVIYSTMVLMLLYGNTLVDRGLLGVVCSFALAAAITGMISAAIRRRKFCTVAKKTDSQLVSTIFRDSMPVGGSRLLRLTGNKIDTLLLFLLKSAGEVALYSGVYSLLLRLINIPFLFSRPLFPLLSRLADLPEKRKDLERITGKAIKFMFLLAAPICVVSTILADQIIGLIFGPEFLPSIRILQTLNWVLLFMFPCAFASFVIIAIKEQHYLFKALTACIGLNVLLDLFLIPSLGYWGPCIATLAAEMLFSFLLWFKLRKKLPGTLFFQGTLRIFLCSCFIGIVLYVSHDLPLLFNLCLAPVAYLVLLHVFKVITPDEISLIRNMLKKKV